MYAPLIWIERPPKDVDYRTVYKVKFYINSTYKCFKSYNFKHCDSGKKIKAF